MNKSLAFFLGINIFITGLSLESRAQLKGVFYDVSFSESLRSVKTKLSKHCGSMKVFLVEPPNYPLAGKSEQHLVCSKIKIGDELIREVVFAFGDDKLSLIEARGGAVKTLIPKATVEAQKFMNFQSFFKDLMVADTKKDAVWLLNKESAHPNLFAWSNPYLPSNKGKKKKYNESAKTPQILQFGARKELLRSEFEKQCKIVFVREITKPSLPTKPKTQTQIECFGFEYAGFPRKIEAIFGDNILEMAWILTGKEEEGRVRGALIKAYGQPDFVSEQWETFRSGQVALRKDKPEVLVMSEKMADLFKKNFLKK